jgi:hypothetical protein
VVRPVMLRVEQWRSKSETHNRSGPSGANRRLTRSSLRTAAGSRRVQPRRRLWIPTIPLTRINRAPVSGDPPALAKVQLVMDPRGSIRVAGDPVNLADPFHH